ncbi:hypothetical protein NM208_g14319 [Fusarium decemcellulare]|uniref:Uncharacterized protein n=1 Tax=Fusarium decemcellulare TaxID=57161 RepID=A0ACC1RJZ5_9HYPO|nr:hypothetical protein NM208_g14319 [Fusarium decemcellulare]
MGKLIKNHWARLIILSAAAYQVGAAIEAFIWPKIFWDFLTHSLDGAVKPIPVLQIINLIMGLLMFGLEWPLGLRRRLTSPPLAGGTNAAIYYLIGMIVYFWGYSEGEIICAKPWSLPQRGRSGGATRA